MKLLSSVCGVIVALAIVGTARGQAAPVKKTGVIVRVPDSGTLGVALSPDGKILARAGTGEKTGQTVDLWNVASGKQLHTLNASSPASVRTTEVTSRRRVRY
jgi:WD40 repeat protein